jgi:alkylation response protein AidB-like acyl-CoA dehydrogenase
MPIAITSEHQDLAESVRALVRRAAPAEFLHATLETPLDSPPPYWRAAAEQGLHGLHLAESVGGQGFGLLELAVAIAEFGYGAVPGPYVPSAIASALIAAHDPDTKLLAELAAGDSIAAVAISSDLTATRHNGIVVIRGEARSVPAAAQASVLVLPVAIESGIEWAVLDAGQLEIEPLRSVDPLRPVAHVRANGVEIEAERLLSNVSQAAGGAIITTLLSAEAVGLARWATDTASEYAKIREQFGRPIGQFQAIKHKCAGMIATTERATAAVWDAARAIDEAAESGRDAGTWDNESTHYEFAAAVAATLAPAAAQHCAQDCIQVHGGIGFTWEHDTNVYYRHTLGLVAAFGRPNEYPRQVFDAATTTGMRPLDIDLDPDTEKLRDAVRAEVAALKAIPGEERKAAIAEGGWVLPYLPPPWGRAATPVEQIIISQEFSTGRVKRPNMGIAAWLIPSIVAYGTEEQKQRFLPRLASGEVWGGFALTEPSAGTDSAGTRTTAVLDGDHYVVNGTKNFITNGGFADIFVVFVRGDTSDKHAGISAFIVEKGTPGFSIGKKENKLGIRASSTTELVFEDCRLPKENLLGEWGGGFKVAMKTLDNGRIGIAAQAHGIAQRALDLAVKYAKEREQFDRPLAKFQHLQFRLADMATDVEAARLLIMQAAWEKDQGVRHSKAAAMAKLFASEAAHRVCHQSLQIHGGYGYIKEYEIERLYRDQRITEIYEGTSEAMRMVISANVLR